MFVAVIDGEGDQWTWVIEDISSKGATGVVATLPDAAAVTTAFVT
jgi:hypothetical protein